MNRLFYLSALSILLLLSVAAQTAVNLTRDVTGILPTTNQGTGVATCAAGTLFSGPLSGSAVAPTCKTISPFVVRSMPTPNQRRWATILSVANSNAQFIGDVRTTAGTQAGVENDPSYEQFTSSAVNGNVAGMRTAQNYVAGRDVYFGMVAAITNTSDVRNWLGFSTNTPTNQGASDNPAGNYAEFWYCNDSGANCQKAGVGFDASTYWCITKDGTTQEIHDSTVTTDTANHTFEIIETAGVQFDFYIDGVNVCTNNTNIPAAGSIFYLGDGVTCVGCGAGKGMRWARGHVESAY